MHNGKLGSYVYLYVRIPKRGRSSIKQPSKAEDNASTEREKLMQQNPRGVNGIGKHPTQLKMHIDNSVHPRAPAARPMPIAEHPQVDAALQECLDRGIMEKAQGPTAWVSLIIVVPRPRQPDRVRLSTDRRVAKRASQRERHPLPTVDDIIHGANGATIFSMCTTGTSKSNCILTQGP